MNLVSAAVIVILIAAVVTLTMLWYRQREELLRTEAHREALEFELKQLHTGTEATTAAPTWAPDAILTATKVVGTVVETATQTARRIRERGVGGMLLASLDDFARWAAEQQPQIAQIAGPDGTVTIFFSDIEDSTQLNHELGDTRWIKVLSAHDALVATYVEKHRGLVVKNQGDGYMVVFSEPALAVAAALEIQQALDASWNRSWYLRRTPIQVRIGLHAGPVVERNGDFFGQNVAFAARVANQAAGGQVLVSDEVAEVLATEAKYQLTQVGSVELKGFPGDHLLWQVQAAP